MFFNYVISYQNWFLKQIKLLYLLELSVYIYEYNDFCIYNYSTTLEVIVQNLRNSLKKTENYLENSFPKILIISNLLFENEEIHFCIFSRFIQ